MSSLSLLLLTILLIVSSLTSCPMNLVVHLLPSQLSIWNKTIELAFLKFPVKVDTGTAIVLFIIYLGSALGLNIGGIKLTVVFFDGYENDTTTDQSFDFPIAYANDPVIIIGNSTLPALSASTTALTITAPDATTTYTGYAVIAGQ